MVEVQPVRHATVLLGGGIDSAALVQFLLDEGFAIKGLHYDYGQPALTQERAAVDALAAHYGICIEKLCRPPISRTGEEYLGRNAAIVLDAMAHANRPGVVAIGIHAGTPFYDCSSDFLTAMQAIVAGYSRGTLRVLAPWIASNKVDIVSFAKARGVPLHLTYSCQQGLQNECGTCRSCLDRKALAC